jgi:arylsulfatase A-like enzyme
MTANLPKPLVAALAAVIVAALASAPGAAARPAAAAKDGRPNILVVMTDDMASTDVKFMPNVRRLLARKGTTFTDAVDSFPLCCPARATFITGQYAHNHDVKGNFYPYGWYGMKDRRNILPAWLNDAGYRTAAIGKWLNGYGALDGHGEIPAGFDIWRGLLDTSAYDYFNYVMNSDGHLRYWGDKDFARGLVEFANIEVTPNPGGLAGVVAKLREVFGPAPYTYWGTENAKDYSPDVTGQVAINLVRRERKEKKPFFIWWSPAAPHREDVSTTLMGRPGADPRPAPRYADDVSKYELPEGPSFNEPDIADKSTNLKESAPSMTPDQIEQLKLDYQGRAGSLMAVDDHVGDLVRTLRKTHQLKNTMIVFVSDNGWLQGEHRITGDKFLPFDESLKVPLIIRGPGIPKGEKVKGQVSNVDFAPTLLDMANAKAGRVQDGVSLLPAMRDPSKAPDRAIAIEALARLFEGNIPVNGWDRPYQGVRTERYTYVVWTETGEKELYDRKRDPHELHNVSGRKRYAKVEKELARKSRRLEDCKGHGCDVGQ